MRHQVFDAAVQSSLGVGEILPKHFGLCVWAVDMLLERIGWILGLGFLSESRAAQVLLTSKPRASALLKYFGTGLCHRSRLADCPHTYCVSIHTGKQFLVKEGLSQLKSNEKFSKNGLTSRGCTSHLGYCISQQQGTSGSHKECPLNPPDEGHILFLSFSLGFAWQRR